MLSIRQPILVQSETNMVSNKWLHYLFERFPWFRAVWYNISIPWMVELGGVSTLAEHIGKHSAQSECTLMPSASELSSQKLSSLDKRGDNLAVKELHHCCQTKTVQIWLLHCADYITSGCFGFGYTHPDSTPLHLHKFWARLNSHILHNFPSHTTQYHLQSFSFFIRSHKQRLSALRNSQPGWESTMIMKHKDLPTYVWWTLVHQMKLPQI